MATPNTTPFAPTGNSWLDVMTNGSQWILPPTRTLTWATSNFDYFYWNDPFAAKVTIENALSKYSAVANINFEYKGHYSAPGIAPADMVFSLMGWPYTEAIGMGNALAWAYFPNQSLTDSIVTSQFGSASVYPSAEGDVYVNVSSEAIYYPTYPGSQGFFVLLHEIGHALGLKHPHDGGGTGRPTFSQVGLSALDIDYGTVMSYNDDAAYNWYWGDPSTLMPLDVYALQWLYGPNTTTHAGDTVHTLQLNNQFQTIWDASGNDSVDASASNLAWSINLSGVLAGVATPMGNSLTRYWLYANAIENVYGSAYGDVISGNAAANYLSGLNGADTIAGGAGNDTLLGGAGNDVVNGDSGNDLLTGGTGSDSLNGGPGSDTYAFALGDGQDVVIDVDSTPGNIDTLTFGAGIAPSDVGVYRSGSDLVLARRGSYEQDRVRLQQFDLGTSYQIERVTFTGNATVWTPANLLSSVEHAGTVIAGNNAARSGQTTPVAGMFQVTDPDGGSPYSYELWDGGAGGGYFRVGGVQQAAGVAIPVSAAQLATTQYVGGPGIGSETVYVRAYDWLAWTSWASWTMYTHNRASNNVPTVNAASRNIDLNQWRLITELVGVADADGDAINQYQVRDATATANGGYLWGNGAAQPQGATLTLTSLSDVWVRGGATASTNVYEVRAFDGVGWGSWTPFTLTTRLIANRAPVATPTAANRTVVRNATAAASGLFGVSDLDGDAPTQYEFWDSAGGGFFRVGGVAKGAGVSIPVTAGQLGTTEYVGGAASGTETVWVRAYDGQAWSSWASWTMQTVRATNVNPVVSAANRNIDLNQWRLTNELASVTDTDGDAIVRYELRDLTATANSGYLWANGAAAAQGATVSVASLADTWVRGGAVAGADAYQIRALDSESGWSNWTAFNLNTRTQPNRAPVATPTAGAQSVQTNQTVAASTLFGVSDPDGDAPFSFELWDGGAGGGYFRIGGVQQAANASIPVTAAQLASTEYVGGAAPGSETLWVRVNDGQASSNWTSWNMNTLA